MNKPSKKKRSGPTLAHRLEYAAVRMLALVANSLRPSARLRFAKFVGWFASRFMPFIHGRIRENLLIAFPDWTPAQRDALMPEIFQHATLLALEALSVGRLTRADLDRRIESSENFDAVHRLAQEKKGVVILCGHFGAWEWGWLYLVHQFGDVMAVTKHLHNPLVDEYVWDVRRQQGLKSQFVSDSMKGMIKHLRAGKMLVIMPDQDARRNGIFIPFFGRLASTATGPAWLAYHLDVPLVHASILRAPGGNYRIRFDEPIWADANAPENAEIERLTREHTAALERAIRQAPAQYFWFHRRWKTRPKSSPASASQEISLHSAESTPGAAKV